jgi:glycolate oxidase FAD binding subunit
MGSQATIVSSLQALLGQNAVYPWEAIPPPTQAHLARSIAIEATERSQAFPCCVYPQNSAELAAVVACASKNQWRILPWGHGSKLSWGRAAQNVDILLSTAYLDRVIDHAAGDLTVTAEAGLALQTLQTQLTDHRQFLALNPAYAAHATLGGIIATADSGSLRHRYGGVRDMLLGIEFVRSDGQIAKAGGRVVKNVAGYDLMKLFTGSYGTLGILTQVTFRLYPIPDVLQTVVLTGKPEIIAQAAQTLLASALTPIALDLLSTAVVQQLNLGQDLGQAMGLAIRFGSVEAGVQEQVKQVKPLAQSLNLQVTCLAADADPEFWQQLATLLELTTPNPTSSFPPLQGGTKGGQAFPPQPETHKGSVLCKIGVLPTHAVETLQHFDRPEFQQAALGVIHLGSGLGLLRFREDKVRSVMIEKVRSSCQAQGGFLTLLEGSSRLKQQLEVWGYQGNGLQLMEKLKHQFDPKQILSPQRFVGTI